MGETKWEARNFAQEEKFAHARIFAMREFSHSVRIFELREIHIMHEIAPALLASCIGFLHFVGGESASLVK